MIRTIVKSLLSCQCDTREWSRDDTIAVGAVAVLGLCVLAASVAVIKIFTT